MDEYIKREDALRYAQWEGAYKVEQYIEELPPEDVQPVKHGRWKDGEKSQVCTICGGWGLDSFAHCPHCGARMDLKDGDVK